MAAGSLREAINSDNDSSIGITLASMDLSALYYSHLASGLISFILWMKKMKAQGGYVTCLGHVASWSLSPLTGLVPAPWGSGGSVPTVGRGSALTIDDE